jgi:hypothetical protein
MARTPQQTKAERLENLAFWYWEYLRRNPVYIEWSCAMNRLTNHLSQYPETMAEVLSADKWLAKINTGPEDKTWQDVKFSPERKVIEERHGKRAGEIYHKYNIFCVSFGSRFKRTYRTFDEGMDTEECLKLVFNRKDDISFKPIHISDVAALLNLHDDWMVGLGGYEPNYMGLLTYQHATLPIGPEITTEMHHKACLEYEVINLMCKAIDYWGIQEPTVDEETASATIELLTELKSVNTANVMRLAMLWLWDRMLEDYDESLDSDELFKKHWGVLKDRANAAGLNEAPWNQIYDKKKRVHTAFLNTIDCIMQVKIIDLNTKR